jgi:hypothetical protein
MGMILALASGVLTVMFEPDEALDPSDLFGDAPGSTRSRPNCRNAVPRGELYCGSCGSRRTTPSSAF